MNGMHETQDYIRALTNAILKAWLLPIDTFREIAERMVLIRDNSSSPTDAQLDLMSGCFMVLNTAALGCEKDDTISDIFFDEAKQICGDWGWSVKSEWLDKQLLGFERHGSSSGDIEF